MEALAGDEATAERIVARPAPPKAQPTRRISEWSTQVELLSVIADRLGELIAAHAATKGAKVKPPRPMPRPVTALQRVERRRRETKHRALAARVLPADA